ncbi:MAG TPA: helix-turn-helix transcriptional regulator [Polyangiaceae bacterium]|nr:helix-turn-helix transcriptional regulator [Polyangiaceae bacterium]
MDAIAMKLAERVRRLRLEARLTQAELAAGAGVTVETVARLERVLRGRASANANPSLETLTRLAAALGVEVTDLLAPSKAARPKDDRLAALLRGATEPTRKLAVRVVEVLVREAGKGPGKPAPRTRRRR